MCLGVRCLWFEQNPTLFARMICVFLCSCASSCFCVFVCVRAFCVSFQSLCLFGTLVFRYVLRCSMLLCRVVVAVVVAAVVLRGTIEIGPNIVGKNSEMYRF